MEELAVGHMQCYLLAVGVALPAADGSRSLRLNRRSTAVRQQSIYPVGSPAEASQAASSAHHSARDTSLRAVVRGSAWEPYLRGASETPPQQYLLARIFQGLRPWLGPSQWQSSIRTALRFSSVATDAVREALRLRRHGSGGRSSDSSVSNSDSSVSDSSAMHEYDFSGMADLLPVDVAWQMAEEESHVKHGKMHYNTSTGMDFDINVASALAHLNSIAYCNHSRILEWNCTRCTGTATGFELYALVDDVAWDLFAFVGHSPVLGAKVVAFRGTDSHSWYNWAENMRFWRSDIGLPYPGAEGALVHSGFFNSYVSSSLKPNITAAAVALEAQFPDEPWYVLGHSMGSAMASICALDLKFALNLTDVRVYTFGSPRVGNDIFAKFFADNIKESFRLTHNRDIVPSVPLQYMGFHHVSREACTTTRVWVVTFDRGPTIIVYCDGSGEDPTCHNSVCYLGLCTSIADHMIYLGAHMFHSNNFSC